MYRSNVAFCESERTTPVVFKNITAANELSPSSTKRPASSVGTTVKPCRAPRFRTAVTAAGMEGCSYPKCRVNTRIRNGECSTVSVGRTLLLDSAHTSGSLADRHAFT
jgi:hypothetical protein